MWAVGDGEGVKVERKGGEKIRGGGGDGDGRIEDGAGIWGWLQLSEQRTTFLIPHAL